MLIHLLATIRSARDVGALFRALGYAPADGDYGDAGFWVARWRGLRVLAASAPEPAAAAARDLAHRLSASGERAITVAVSADTLAIAATQVGLPHGTRALTIPLCGASPDAVAQLERLRPHGASNALALLLRVADVLSTERVGERFFSGFRSLLERMASSLGGRGTADDRRTAALLSLSRMLFLYFVQAKGWLAADPHYLRTAFDRALAGRRHFHRTVLAPLFFRTLNRPPSARPKGRPVPGVPYLNGGLFERHPVERRLGPVHFENALWREAFDGLFERYRFSVREADDANAIAPDMLGRVFERLMDAGERHRSGAYYTPEALVRQIVEHTLAVALPQLGVEQSAVDALCRGEQVGRHHRCSVGRALRRLRLLDPSAGSGAFLLGALDVLTDWNLAALARHDACTRWRLRRRILGENLFGVDLNPMAVRLAELRLWLAVVADDPTTSPSDVTPLPNLDGVVLQGDALLDPIAAIRLRAPHAGPPAALVSSVETARRALFEARGTARAPAVRALRGSEAALARVTIDAALGSTERALADLAASEASPDLFGAARGLTPAQRAARDALESDRRALLEARSRIAEHAVPFFSFEVHLPAFAGRGFDVVVGNPPWVRAERLPPAYRRVLSQRFPTWESGGARGFRHQPDLAVAFLERALELAAPGGAVGLLLPSKLASAGYGAAARRCLVRDTTIQYLHRVPDRQASAFGATTYPLALVTRKAAPAPGHAVRLGFESGEHRSQASLSRDGPWILLSDSRSRAFDALRQCGVPLGQVAHPALGLKTGADRILVGSLLSRQGQLAVVRFGDAEVTLESTVLRPAVRGRDVGPFRAAGVHVVFWGYDRAGRPLATVPPRAARHAQANAEALRARRDYRGGPLWSVFRVRAALGPYRVVWPDIARRPTAVALDVSAAANAVPLNTCYVVSAPTARAALALSAVINSSWTAVLATATADEARGGYRRYNASVMEAIRVPADPDRHPDLADLAARAHGGSHVDQNELDEAVADALGLAQADRGPLHTLAADQG